MSNPFERFGLGNESVFVSGQIAPDDVAEAVLMLADSKFISGESIRVDGGLLSSLRLLPPREE